jgi:hypothetical protein
VHAQREPDFADHERPGLGWLAAHGDALGEAAGGICHEFPGQVEQGDPVGGDGQLAGLGRGEQLPEQLHVFRRGDDRIVGDFTRQQLLCRAFLQQGQDFQNPGFIERGGLYQQVDVIGASGVSVDIDRHSTDHDVVRLSLVEHAADFHQIGGCRRPGEFRIIRFVFHDSNCSWVVNRWTPLGNGRVPQSRPIWRWS